jgi:hypothetical protein
MVVGAADYRRRRPDSVRVGFAALFRGSLSSGTGRAGVTGSVKHRVPTPTETTSAPAVSQSTSITLVAHLDSDPGPRATERRRKLCDIRLAVSETERSAATVRRRRPWAPPPA